MTSVERLAAQAPWWEPGTASGYHAVNMGHLIGELIKRTSGKTLKQFVSDEIATPLGADFQIGAAEQDWPRVASLVPPPPAAFDFSKLDPNSPTVKTFANPAMDATNAHTPEWRRADLGAVNGHGNARSLTRPSTRRTARTAPFARSYTSTRPSSRPAASASGRS